MSLQSLRVFISYSRKNKDFVEKLVGKLQNRCNPWWDQRLTPAEVWWLTVLENVEECDCFVLILTSTYASSIFCLTELEYAQNLGKPILPVILDSTVRFPAGVSHSQAAYIDGFNVGEAFGEIIAGLSGLKPEQYSRHDGNVIRPIEPTPNRKAQISDLYAEAAEAETDGNLSLAERFYEQITTVDHGKLGKLAKQRLQSLQERRKCFADYENIVRLAASPKTLSFAVDLWDIYKNECGTDYDHKGFARDQRFFTTESTRILAKKLVPPRYVSGQRIYHQKFGEGIVIAAKLRGDDQEVDIKFLSENVIKRLSANLANLKTINAISVLRSQTAQPRYKSGQRVRHRKFGVGIVIASKVRGEDEEVDIKFQNERVIKRLSANLANLEIIDEA